MANISAGINPPQNAAGTTGCLWHYSKTVQSPTNDSGFGIKDILDCLPMASSWGILMRYMLLLVMVLLFPGLAQAEWLETSSDHFVVYGNADEKNLQRFSEQLEHYHMALAAVSGLASSKPSPSNRVTVFLVDNESTVQKLMGAGSKYVGGFYVPRAGASIAIIPRVSSAANGRVLEYSMVVLLHEYAHHFFISNSAYASPRWLSEGAAEFFASAKFESDGSVG
ncbi:MAG: hypothetical protein ABIW31_08580, partial [Novosphingobium sp.]